MALLIDEGKAEKEGVVEGTSGKEGRGKKTGRWQSLAEGGSLVGNHQSHNRFSFIHSMGNAQCTKWEARVRQLSYGIDSYSYNEYLYAVSRQWPHISRSVTNIKRPVGRARPWSKIIEHRPHPPLTFLHHLCHVGCRIPAQGQKNAFRLAPITLLEFLLRVVMCLQPLAGVLQVSLSVLGIADDCV